MRCEYCDEKMSRLGRQKEVFCDCGEPKHEDHVCKTCCDAEKQNGGADVSN